VRQDEHREQCTVIQWANWQAKQWPELRLLFAVPNGGARDVVTGARMKREGQKKGVPDLVLACPRNGYHGLFIELKTKKGRVSPEQSEWLRQLSAQGYRAEVCRGADAAIRVLREYLAGVENGQSMA
jgi:hypothetical protein